MFRSGWMFAWVLLLPRGRDKNENVHSGAENYTYVYKYNYVDNETYLGAGLHWGNFFIDGYVDPMMITDGFYFLSGNSTDWAYQVSLKYRMF